MHAFVKCRVQLGAFYNMYSTRKKKKKVLLYCFRCGNIPKGEENGVAQKCISIQSAVPDIECCEDWQCRVFQNR